MRERNAAQLLPPIHPQCRLSYHGNHTTGQGTYRVLSQTSSTLLLLPFSWLVTIKPISQDKLPDYNQSSRVNPVPREENGAENTPKLMLSHPVLPQR